MKTEWDYTERPMPISSAPTMLLTPCKSCFTRRLSSQGTKFAISGAGVAHLTLPLAAFGCLVDAVEPNDAMRRNGQQRTAHLPNVTWSEGTGEASGRPTGAYAFVTFGSSFNACDPDKALRETHRLLKPGSCFTCMWNHRNLEDPIQKHIESIIKGFIPEYGYGTRREDQTEVILASGLFHNVEQVEGTILHHQSVQDVVEAWRSHATLHRQAGEHFQSIIREIASYLSSLRKDTIDIPYTTHAWIARRKD